MVQRKADRHKNRALVIPPKPKDMPLLKSIAFSLKTSYRHVGRGLTWTAFIVFWIVAAVSFLIMLLTNSSGDIYSKLGICVFAAFISSILVSMSILGTTAVYLSLEASGRTVKSKYKQLKHKRVIKSLTHSSDLSGALNITDATGDEGGQLAMVSEKGAVTLTPDSDHPT